MVKHDLIKRIGVKISVTNLRAMKNTNISIH